MKMSVPTHMMTTNGTAAPTDQAHALWLVAASLLRTVALASAVSLLPALAFAEGQNPTTENAAIKMAQGAPNAQQPTVAARAWLGIRIKDVTPEIVASEGVQSLVGALVVEVVPGSPAMGILVPGDIVLDVNNQEVISAHDLTAKIQRVAPGTNVTLKIWRDHAATDVSARLGVLPPMPPR
jgi:S1-C subfamily serine protease